MSEYRDKLKTIAIGGRAAGSDKVTTDEHDNHQVHVIEHWDDRQSVTVDFSKGGIGKKKGTQ